MNLVITHVRVKRSDMNNHQVSAAAISRLRKVFFEYATANLNFQAEFSLKVESQLEDLKNQVMKDILALNDDELILAFCESIEEDLP